MSTAGTLARTITGRSLRACAGAASGAVTALAELVFLLVAGLALVVPAARPRVYERARRLAELERRRLARLGHPVESRSYSDIRALRYLAARSGPGLLGGVILLLIGWGLLSAVLLLHNLVTGGPVDGSRPPEWYEPIVVGTLGLVLFFLAVQGLLTVATLEHRLAQRFLGPSRTELLRHRISHLTVSRDEVLRAVHEERRRIERDLHDGVQQQLVALGMLLGRARRAGDQRRVENLLEQAHEQAQRVLGELREVTWRVYPAVLDSGGLRVALEELTERSPVPVRLHYEADHHADRAIEAVAYFVVSEAVTNTIKHADATRIDVAVRPGEGTVQVRVSDNGAGGAHPRGGGLSGLSHRVTAVDGQFTVDSPPGGPTVITAVLPCG